MPSLRPTTLLGRFVSAYGMLGVLILLCVYFSWATLQEYQPRGASAGAALAKRVAGSVPKPANVVVAAGTGEEDQAFADALEERLKSGGYAVVAKAVGAPREAAVALRRLNEAGTPVAVVATTPEMAQLPVLADLGRRFPGLGSPEVLTTPGGRWPMFLTRQNLTNIASQIVVVA